MLYTNNVVDDHISEDVDTSSIISDILSHRCILLIGPEVLKTEGEPASDKLREFLSKNYSKLLQSIYAKEGLYKFKDETAKKRAQTDAIPQFYRHVKPEEQTLNKLLEIPFHLILQVTSDTFLSDCALAHSVTHEFRYFCGGGKPVEPVDLPTAEIPLFYNLCGTADRYDSMVLDYDDVYDYLKSVFSHPGLPQNLRTALEEANTFLFLGFHLEKWYTQLLIRWVSDVKGAERYAANMASAKRDPEVNSFIRHHLNILTIDKQIDSLIDEIHANVKAAGMLRALSNPVTENTVAVRRFVLNGDLEKALMAFDKLADKIGEKTTSAMLLSQFNELKKALGTYALTKEQYWEKCQNLKYRLLETLTKYAYSL